MESRLSFKRLSDFAFPLTRATPYAAGYDLRSPVDTVIPKRGNCLVKTDLALLLPEGCYGRIAPRSGLALKYCIDVGAGVVDRDYVGNVGVILFNHSDREYYVKRGDRIAQIICEKIFYPELYEVEQLNTTSRGSDGFGSTGI